MPWLLLLRQSRSSLRVRLQGPTMTLSLRCPEDQYAHCSSGDAAWRRLYGGTPGADPAVPVGGRPKYRAA